MLCSHEAEPAAAARERAQPMGLSIPPGLSSAALARAPSGRCGERDAHGSQIIATPTIESITEAHLALGAVTGSERNWTERARVSTGEVEKTAVLSEAGMYSSAAM